MTGAHRTWLALPRWLVASGCLAVLEVLAGLTVHPAAAENVGLPAEQAVKARAVELDLHHATVALVLKKKAKPVLRARRLDPEKSGPVAIDLRKSDGTLRITRTEEDAQSVSPLYLELVLDPRAMVLVTGTKLDVKVEAPGPRAATKYDEDGRPLLTLRVIESDVRLNQVGNVDLSAESSILYLGDTRGPLRLDLRGCSTEVKGHRGPVRWQSATGDDVIADHQGDLELRLRDTRFQLRDSADTPVGEADGGLLVLSGWSGTASLQARRTTLEVISSGGPGSELRLEGVELQASVDHFEGTLDAELRGGVLRGGDVEGSTRITGRRQAAIDLEDLVGPVTVDLHKSTARFANVSEKVEATLHTATLEVDGAQRLEVKAEQAEIVAADLRRLDTISIRETQLDLDLSRIEHNPALVLRGGSAARVRLPAPCSVRVAAEAEALENQIRAAGCDVRGRRRYGETRDLNPPGTTVLVAAVEGDASLEILSSP